MSCCTNPAMACIFGRVAVFPATRLLTCFLMASDASILALTRFAYQPPMPSQLENSFFCDVPPDGKNDTIICPARPCHGGISGSFRIPGMSPTVQYRALPFLSSGFTSGCASHDALNTQPGGSCSE